MTSLSSAWALCLYYFSREDKPPGTYHPTIRCPGTCFLILDTHPHLCARIDDGLPLLGRDALPLQVLAGR